MNNMQWAAWRENISIKIEDRDISNKLEESGLKLFRGEDSDYVKQMAKRLMKDNIEALKNGKSSEHSALFTLGDAIFKVRSLRMHPLWKNKDKNGNVHKDLQEYVNDEELQRWLNTFCLEAVIMEENKALSIIPKHSEPRLFPIYIKESAEETTNEETETKEKAPKKKILFDFILLLCMKKYEPISTEGWQESQIMELERQLLQGLKDIHKMYVHRDIKPENIMTDGEGHYVLIDWDNAAAVTGNNGTRIADEEHDKYIEETDPVGTDYFMCPERLKANGELDEKYRAVAALDLYALGMVALKLSQSDQFIGLFREETRGGRTIYVLKSKDFKILDGLPKLKAFITKAISGTDDSMEKMYHMAAKESGKVVPVYGITSLLLFFVVGVISLLLTYFSGGTVDFASAQVRYGVVSWAAFCAFVHFYGKGRLLSVQWKTLGAAFVFWMIGAVLTLFFVQRRLLYLPAYVPFVQSMPLLLWLYVAKEQLPKTEFSKGLLLQKLLSAGTWGVCGALLGINVGLAFAIVPMTKGGAFLCGINLGSSWAVLLVFSAIGCLISATVAAIVKMFKFRYSNH